MKIFIFILLTAGLLFAQGNKTVEITDLHIGDLKTSGFTLNSRKTIHIQAEGAGEKSEKEKDLMMDPGNMFAYPWIINAKTRKLVWRLTMENSDRSRRTRSDRKFEGDLTLPAGQYEVYYQASKPGLSILDDGFFSFGKLLNKLLHDEEWYKEDEAKWFVRISGVDAELSERAVEKYHEALRKQAIVSITGLQNSDYRQEGFELKKRGTFRIYAVGEAFRGETFDYGWIVDASNSEKVWETLADKSEYAGGAVKNRYWDETITLEPGTYWVYFVMDDSHSPNDWNANPPYDPAFYGLTLTGVAGKYDPDSIEKLQTLKVKPIVEMTRIGDDEHVHEGFKISQQMQIRVYAVGEGRGGEMFDYGWIVNMQTGEKVWEMDYNRTRHAGGAEKNRMIDEVITLPAGSYMVYYKTDDSHSFEGWNGNIPYNPYSWGITIYPADPKYSSDQIQKVESADESENIIAQITKARNNSHIREKFEIDKPTDIRIYAIGEGDWDEMFDYGWIENNDTGKKVWKMTFEESRWAGGAKKNRKVDESITLFPGHYSLHYDTDDSHSYGNWNDDAPDDPIHYGITLYKKGEKK